MISPYIHSGTLSCRRYAPYCPARLSPPATTPPPVAIYSSSPRSGSSSVRHLITGRDLTSFLRSIARTVYNLSFDSTQLKLWGPHSIRVTAANLLHRARYSDSFIKYRLRWKSDSFLMYLQNTFYTADQHSKALDIDIAPPSLTDLRPLEPHEDALRLWPPDHPHLFLFGFYCSSLMGTSSEVDLPRHLCGIEPLSP